MRIRFTCCRSFALLCLVSAGCATAATEADGPTTLSLERPDGASAVCTRPPEAWLDSQAGVGVAAAVPNIVQQLLSSSGSGPQSGDKTPEGGAPPKGGPPRGATSTGATPTPRGSATAGGNILDAIVQTAPNARALSVLDYRLCLVYGKGVLSRDAYVQWLLDLRPRAFKAVRGTQSGG